jgi:mono/diheme cytochrome c family protein
MKPIAQSLAARIAAALFAAAAAALPALAQDDEFAAGREEYLSACAACHGEAADGNGPIATMFTVRVPDLRRISAQNDGVFPTLEIFQIIDGRAVLPAHGNPMPVFGRRYERQAGDVGPYGSEALVRARVLELVYYLQSIQQ